MKKTKSYMPNLNKKNPFSLKAYSPIKCFLKQVIPMNTTPKEKFNIDWLGQNKSLAYFNTTKNAREENF